MAVSDIVGAGLGVVGSSLNLIKGGQERRAQESQQRHSILEMALANRMQQNQLRMQMQNQQLQSSQNQNQQKTSNNVFVFVGIGIIIIALIALILWKQSKK